MPATAPSEPKTPRSLSLPKSVAAAGGISAWNNLDAESKAMSTIVYGLCKATVRQLPFIGRRSISCGLHARLVHRPSLAPSRRSGPSFSLGTRCGRMPPYPPARWGVFIVGVKPQVYVHARAVRPRPRALLRDSLGVAVAASSDRVRRADMTAAAVGLGIDHCCCRAWHPQMARNSLVG